MAENTVAVVSARRGAYQFSTPVNDLTGLEEKLSEAANIPGVSDGYDEIVITIDGVEYAKRGEVFKKSRKKAAA